MNWESRSQPTVGWILFYNWKYVLGFERCWHVVLFVPKCVKHVCGETSHGELLVVKHHLAPNPNDVSVCDQIRYARNHVVQVSSSINFCFHWQLRRRCCIDHNARTFVLEYVLGTRFFFVPGFIQIITMSSCSSR